MQAPRDAEFAAGDQAGIDLITGQIHAPLANRHRSREFTGHDGIVWVKVGWYQPAPAVIGYDARAVNARGHKRGTA